MCLVLYTTNAYVYCSLRRCSPAALVLLANQRKGLSHDSAIMSRVSCLQHMLLICQRGGVYLHPSGAIAASNYTPLLPLPPWPPSRLPLALSPSVIGCTFTADFLLHIPFGIAMAPILSEQSCAGCAPALPRLGSGTGGPGTLVCKLRGQTLL